MKKTFLPLFSIATLFGTLASAEVQFDEKAFEQALESALIKTDVKVFCGEKGQEFTKQMANSLRQVSEAVPNAQTNQSTLAQIEKSARSYEGLCEKAVKKAVQSGLSESEISQLLQK